MKKNTFWYIGTDIYLSNRSTVAQKIVPRTDKYDYMDKKTLHIAGRDQLSSYIIYSI